MREWCELCRDHVESEHWSDGRHLVGTEYGPGGASLLAEEIVRDLAACEPMALRDDDYGADWVCAFCEVVAVYIDPYRWEAVEHKETCLWRRAVEWARGVRT